jgi:hypothetical protein
MEKLIIGESEELLSSDERYHALRKKMSKQGPKSEAE